MIAMNHNLLHDPILERRGIAEAADEAGWKAHKAFGQQGWSYPVYDGNGIAYHTAEGQQVLRWKNSDSNGSPKYAWLPGKPDKATYYVLPDTLGAIRKANGVCYLASGEPDTLAYRAAGFKNVISWFDGEGSIPINLLTHLRFMGIQTLNDYPDRDETGLKKMAKLVALLDGSEVFYRPMKLPGDEQSKNDINWLWVDCNSNRERFTMALLDLPSYTPAEIASHTVVDPAPVETSFVLRQRETLPAQTEFTPAQVTAIEKVAFARFAEALVQSVEQTAGFKGWQADGWSKNFPCNLPGHTDSHASAGFNRDSKSYRCFVCGTVDTKDYAAQTHAKTYDEFRAEVEQEFRETNRQQPAPEPGSRIITMTGATVAPVPAKLYIPSDEALLDVEAMLRGEKLPTYIPQYFPYKTFHQFGGFAKVMQPGKLVYIMSVSGGGKTSLVDAISEKAHAEGQDTIDFSPEWTAQERRKRSIQRAGGMTMMEMAEYEMWLIDQKRGIPLEARNGRPPARERLEQTLEIVQRLKTWQGKSYQLKADPRLGDLTSIINTIREIVVEKRDAGRNVTTLFVDYIQRLPKARGSNEWDRLEAVVDCVKDLCEELSLLGYIIIQPRKSDSSDTRDGKTLTEASAQGLSDQRANLYLTITPQFDENRVKLPFVEASVVKNSMGTTGSLMLKAAWQNLTICDDIYTGPRNTGDSLETIKSKIAAKTEKATPVDDNDLIF